MEQPDEMEQRVKFWDSVFLTAQWLAANGDPAWDRLHVLVEDIRNALSQDMLRAKTTELGELCLLQLAEIHRSFVLHNTLADDNWEPLDAWLRHQQCIQIPDPDP
jgi:hypothetical protein